MQISQVYSGDVVVMQPGCQQRFQHSIKTEATAEAVGPRISLVYKKLRDRGT
jgi:alkylated DNA repair dioxygenase AlkB